jgi:hypothetical protein
MATNLLKTLPGVVVLKLPLKFQFEFSIACSMKELWVSQMSVLF